MGGVGVASSHLCQRKHKIHGRNMAAIAELQHPGLRICRGWRFAMFEQPLTWKNIDHFYLKGAQTPSVQLGQLTALCFFSHLAQLFFAANAKNFLGKKRETTTPQPATFKSDPTGPRLGQTYHHIDSKWSVLSSPTAVFWRDWSHLKHAANCGRE